MRVLFVYDDITCSCTRKCCFELSKSLVNYAYCKIINYSDLNDLVIEESDIVIIQRLGAGKNLSENDKKTILDYIKKYKTKKKFVYLIDDFLLESQDGYPKIMAKECNACICSSEVLKKYLSALNENVFKFHTFVDTNLYDSIEASKFDKFTLVWASTGGFGRSIIRDIIDSREEMGIDFNLIAIGQLMDEFKQFSFVKCYPIIPEIELIKIIKGAQILLNPMIMNDIFMGYHGKRFNYNAEDFMNSKSEVKYAIAGMTKTCVLSSPIDNYTKVIENYKNGIIINNDSKNWIEAIKYLYNNQNILTGISEEAYTQVKYEYSIEKAGEDIYNVLIEIMKI